MKRIALVATTLTIAALASPIVLDAQRGGGGGGRGGAVVHPTTSGVVFGPPTSGPPPAGVVHGGARIGNAGRPMHVPSAPIPSADHPLPYNLNSVNPAPALGRERTPSPFGVGPHYYNRQQPYSIPYGAPYGYGYGAPGYSDTYTTPPPPPQADTALLLLSVTPSTAMVSVDDAFVGSVSDLQPGLELSPGHHWIDLEAPGFDRKTFEINATPGRPARYQAELTPIRTASLAPPALRPPQTMYAIPGCYGGNTPPVQANLPTGCDIAKVRVIRPPQ